MKKSPPRQNPQVGSNPCALSEGGVSFSQFLSKFHLSQFLTYGVVGLANTAIHALVFFVLVVEFASTQAFANLIAFFVAVTASFFLNAHFTFRQKPTLGKFLRMVLVMALLSFASGYAGDILSLNPLVTFVAWCAISYVAGFLLSRYFVFKS